MTECKTPVDDALRIFTSRGAIGPLGATQRRTASGGVDCNFALFAPDCSSVSLLLYRGPDVLKPSCSLCQTITMHRTGHVYHLQCHSLDLPMAYSYDVTTRNGENFVIRDPYGSLTAAGGAKDYGKGTINRCLLVPEEGFDWGDDAAPRHDDNDMILYECHVRGFTIHESSELPPEKRGTFAGLAAKAPYLASLGVTAVELLPVYENDETACPFKDPKTGKPLLQYWGYAPSSFFAPMSRYAMDPMNAGVEFKEMVKTLHAYNIEVILDVVYNHVGHGSGIIHVAKHDFFILGPNGEHTNYSGCGNTLKCNSVPCRQFIVDSLRHWVLEYHIDGFRFDEAPILLRDELGNERGTSPVVDMISYDPILRQARVFAEPWDAAGAYRVGTFPHGLRWKDWNGKFRDSVRQFIKGDALAHREFAARLGGSNDLYGHHSRGRPTCGVNFVTCHDGFYLMDLVSYNEKHNNRNGEDNKDGIDENYSWNCGAEGPTDQKDIKQLRVRQLKNFIVALLLSRGMVMLRMGDEIALSADGNNNTWNQANELNYFDWKATNGSGQHGLLRFVKELIQFRLQFEVVRRDGFVWEEDITWYGEDGKAPQWDEPIPGGGSFVAFSYKDTKHGVAIYVAFNQSTKARKITIPRPSTYDLWMRRADTHWPSPWDIVAEEDMAPLETDVYDMQPFTSLILQAPLAPGHAAYAEAMAESSAGGSSLDEELAASVAAANADAEDFRYYPVKLAAATDGMYSGGGGGGNAPSARGRGASATPLSIASTPISAASPTQGPEPSPVSLPGDGNAASGAQRDRGARPPLRDAEEAKRSGGSHDDEQRAHENDENAAAANDSDVASPAPPSSASNDSVPSSADVEVKAAGNGSTRRDEPQQARGIQCAHDTNNAVTPCG